MVALLLKVKIRFLLMLHHLLHHLPFAALLGAVSANGYQLAVYGNQAKPLTDVQISNIHVKTFFSRTYLDGN